MIAEHLAPNIQLQLLGFGYRLALGSLPIKRLDCAPTSLYKPLIYYKSQGAKLLFLLLPIQSTVLFNSLQALRFCDFLRLAVSSASCNLSPC